MNHHCAVCNKPVEIKSNGLIIRNCEHTSASIIANMSAVAIGQGGIK